MAMAMFLTIALCLEFSPFISAFSLGAAMIVFVGLVDDKYSLSPKMKFAGEIIASLIFISLTHHRLLSFGNVLGVGALNLGPLATVVTVFGMVGFINALNLCDGLDGLTAGLSAIAAVFLLLMACVTTQIELLGVTVIILGVSLGFLRYNTYPARLFMGDTGSLLLGYSLGCITLSLIQKNPVCPIQLKPVTIFTVVSLPVMDTLYVISRRLLKKGRLFAPDKTHLHHRLMSLGLPHPLVVTIIYTFAFFLGLLAWGTRTVPEYTQFYTTIGIFIIFYTFLAYLEKNGLPKSWRYRKKIHAARYSLVAIIGKGNRYFPILFTLCLLFPLPFLGKASSGFGVASLAVVIFTTCAYPWRGGKRDMAAAQATIFLSIFSLVIQYLFVPQPPEWLITYLSTLCAMVALWVVCRVVFRQRYQVIIPTSFEMLLIIFSWFIPLVVVPAFNLQHHTQYLLLLACCLSIPILAGAKTMMRRYARRNTKFVISMQAALLFIALKALI